MARGEGSDWRFTAVAAAPTSSNASRAMRMAGTVAIVASLAVATIVFLTDNNAASSLAAKVAIAVAPTAPKSTAAAVQVSVTAKASGAQPAPSVAKAAAPVKAVSPVGKATPKTQKMSDNWKINEDLPPTPSYADLQREVAELEKEEKQHFDSRASSLNKALSTANDDGDSAGVKSLKWKNAKDKYEQAAYKDIMDEEKERIKDSITEEGAEMFQEYEKKAQSLMGTDELKRLQNSTAIAEQTRTMREKSALHALRSANQALKKVEREQDKEREEEDEKKQARANAKVAEQLQKSVHAESGSKEYYKKVAAAKAYDSQRSEEAVKRKSSYAADRQALKTREPEKLHPEHADTPYHKDYLEAETIEDQRNTAFAEEIKELKEKTEAQRKVRAHLLEADAERSKDEEVAAKKEQKAVRNTEEKEEKQVADVIKESKGKGKGKLSVTAARAKDDVSMSKDYEATVQAAMEADLLRRAKERKARKAFRKERAKKLLADMSQADEIEKSYATVSDDIMQPSQLINAARANQGEGDKGGAARIIRDRDAEVNLIMGGK